MPDYRTLVKTGLFGLILEQSWFLSNPKLFETLENWTQKGSLENNLDWFKRHSNNYALRNMFADFEEKLQAHNLIQVIDVTDRM